MAICVFPRRFWYDFLFLSCRHGRQAKQFLVRLLLSAFLSLLVPLCSVCLHIWCLFATAAVRVPLWLGSWCHRRARSSQRRNERSWGRETGAGRGEWGEGWRERGAGRGGRGGGGGGRGGGNGRGGGEREEESVGRGPCDTGRVGERRRMCDS